MKSQTLQLFFERKSKKGVVAFFFFCFFLFRILYSNSLTILKGEGEGVVFEGIMGTNTIEESYEKLPWLKKNSIKRFWFLIFFFWWRNRHFFFFFSLGFFFPWQNVHVNSAKKTKIESHNNNETIETRHNNKNPFWIISNKLLGVMIIKKE